MDLRDGDVIASKYQIIRKLGEGSYGKVHAAVDEDNQYFAVKVEKSMRGDLRREKTVYEDIAFNQFGYRPLGIPRMFCFGKTHGHDFLVVEFLGPSLVQRGREVRSLFSLKTCLMLGIQLISRLEHIHNCGYLHRDIKIDNVLTGLGSTCRQIYLVDFGLAIRYRDRVTGKHWEHNRFTGFSGTFDYASTNVMKGIRPSRRDDLQSLGYAFFKLRWGYLPWERLCAIKDHRILTQRIMEMKMDLDLSRFCEGFPGLHEYMRYVRDLRFQETPKYSFLVNCFVRALHRMGMRNEGDFDWLQGR